MPCQARLEAVLFGFFDIIGAHFDEISEIFAVRRTAAAVLIKIMRNFTAFFIKYRACS